MDRIKMTREDTDRLFDWMMAHEDYIKRIPAPLGAIKIIFEYNPLRVRFRRNQNKLTIYASTSEHNLGKLDMELRDGRFVPQKDVQTLGITSEALIHVFSVYIGLMAYMVYGKVEAHVEGSKRAMREHANGSKNARIRSTYSLIWNQTEPSGVSHGGHHASPKGCFTVRGHYRHYKSGNIVWIKEYTKGKGKPHGRLYKLGGIEHE